MFGISDILGISDIRVIFMKEALEHIEQPEGEREYTMEDFRAEILAKQEAQAQPGEKYVSEDLKHINVEDLTQEDFEIWEKIRNKTLSMKDVEEYRNSIRLVFRDLSEGRSHFFAFVMNRAQLLRLS